MLTWFKEWIPILDILPFQLGIPPFKDFCQNESPSWYYPSCPIRELRCQCVLSSLPECWKCSSTLCAPFDPPKKLLKSVGFYNMPWKALKYLNKTFNKDSPNKVKGLNWIQRSTLMAKLMKKLYGVQQEDALVEMVHVTPKNYNNIIFAQKQYLGEQNPTSYLLKLPDLFPTSLWRSPTVHIKIVITQFWI